MDWGSFIGPAVVAAAVSGIVSVVGLVVSTRTARAIHTEKLAFDREQAAQKLAFDERLAERKFAFDKQLAEHKFEFDKELAERKFQSDARLVNQKRLIELAEATLVDFYEVKAAIQWARFSPRRQDEGKTREHPDGEGEEETRIRNMIFAPIERLKQYEHIFARLHASRLRFQAWFGADAGKYFDEVSYIRRDIASAIDRLIAGRIFGEVEGDDKMKVIAGWIEVIRIESDPIAQRLDAAIAAIEAICEPTLGHKLERP